MLYRIMRYAVVFGVVFLSICLISIIQHWDYISQSLLSSTIAFISSMGVVFIIIIGIVFVLKSLRR